MAIALIEPSSDDVREAPFDASEVERTDHEHDDRDRERGGHAEIEWVTQETSAETFDQSRHRIELEQPTLRLRDDRRGIDHRRHEHPDLQHEGDDVSEVAIANHERRD